MILRVDQSPWLLLLRHYFATPILFQCITWAVAYNPNLGLLYRIDEFGNIRQSCWVILMAVFLPAGDSVWINIWASFSYPSVLKVLEMRKWIAIAAIYQFDGSSAAV